MIGFQTLGWPGNNNKLAINIHINTILGKVAYLVNLCPHYFDPCTQSVKNCVVSSHQYSHNFSHKVKLATLSLKCHKTTLNFNRSNEQF